eukprot:NODE_663_length_4918_cov_0.396140.p2 type:complete len:267 gc:universal NODE_663_length_4918_cov_0.396140:681-1481(+)
MEQILSQITAANLEQLQPILINNSKLSNLSIPLQSKVIKTAIAHLFQLNDSIEAKSKFMSTLLEHIQSNNLQYLFYQINHQFIQLLIDYKQYNQSLSQIQSILHDLKKLDDKPLLIQIYIQQSISYYHLNNIQNSKTSLISAKTLSQSIYIPPSLQLQLDNQSGLVHLLNKEYTIAYSYFYESVEQLHHLGKENQPQLNYLILCQIMSGEYAINNKYLHDGANEKKTTENVKSLQCQGLLKIAESCVSRSLNTFNDALHQYKCNID